MSSELSIEAVGLGKAYAIFKRPQDRLKQMLSLGRRRYFEEYWALRDIDLTVRRGETVALIGHNGSGKSTLLQLVCGTVTPTTGRIAVHGRVAPLLELGAGFNPEFTGRENIHLAAMVLGLTAEQAAERAEAIAAFADIGDFLDQPVKLYSSGMYARLAFAVVAHVDADILIVDEILSVGDAAFQQKCMRFIRRFRETGTLLFVSHDISSVLSLCDKAVWLDAGSVRAAGPAKEVCEAYVAAVAGGRSNANAFRIGGTRKPPPEPELPRDPREDKMRELGLLPKAQVFQFDPDAPWFGERGASIQAVRITDPAGRPLETFSGGEEIVLRVEAVAHRDLGQPIVGFVVKDRLGQGLFGDNTFLNYSDPETRVPAGSRVVAEFEFRIPYLPAGDYSVSAAISEGTQADHVQQHWMDDALLFRVISSPLSVKGLVGLPMKSIRLDIRPDPLPSEARRDLPV